MEYFFSRKISSNNTIQEDVGLEKCYATLFLYVLGVMLPQSSCVRVLFSQC